MNRRTFVFALPPYDPKSNGVAIYYDLARMFAENGHMVLATPHNNASSRKGAFFAGTQEEEFKTVTPLEVLPEWIPVFSDSSLPEFTDQFKCNVRVWYLMNKPYALTGEGCKYWANDLVLCFSKYISAHYPVYFFNRRSADLRSATQRVKPHSQRANRICFYIGKSISMEIPAEVKALALKHRSSIATINRTLPERKDQLWSLLASSRLLVSSDPVTNLNYESTLLGTPCFISSNYTHTDYKNFELPLHGISDQAEDLEPMFLKGMSADQHKGVLNVYDETTTNHEDTAKAMLHRIDRHVEDCSNYDSRMKEELELVNQLRTENDLLRHECAQLKAFQEPNLAAGYSLKPFLSLPKRLLYLALRLEALAILAILRVTTNAQIASECFHKIDSYRQRREHREARAKQIQQMRRPYG